MMPWPPHLIMFLHFFFFFNKCGYSVSSFHSKFLFISLGWKSLCLITSQSQSQVVANVFAWLPGQPKSRFSLNQKTRSQWFYNVNFILVIIKLHLHRPSFFTKYRNVISDLEPGVFFVLSNISLFWQNYGIFGGMQEHHRLFYLFFFKK